MGKLFNPKMCVIRILATDVHFSPPSIHEAEENKGDNTKERESKHSTLTNAMEEINNDNVEGEVVEEEVVVLPGKTKMPHARMLCSSPVHEELQKQMVECTTMSGVLMHEYHPITEEATNPWVKLHALLHDPESGD